MRTKVALKTKHRVSLERCSSHKITKKRKKITRVRINSTDLYSCTMFLDQKEGATQQPDNPKTASTNCAISCAAGIPPRPLRARLLRTKSNDIGRCHHAPVTRAGQAPRQHQNGKGARTIHNEAVHVTNAAPSRKLHPNSDPLTCLYPVSNHQQYFLRVIAAARAL